MWILVDGRIPEQAKNKLAKYGKLIELNSENIVYDAISGHPDIFFCRAGNLLITAPNLPEKYKNILNNNHIPYTIGREPAGQKYPESAKYNAVVTDEFLIHRLNITDPSILDASTGREKINVGQGYCRCNLVPLKNNTFITSDRGIQTALSKRNINVHYFSPKSILLSGHDHGFLGGVCGLHENCFFLLGSLKYFTNGKKLSIILEQAGYEIIELYNGKLFDGGSLFFI